MNSRRFTYSDILHLPHPEPRRHKRMPMQARAAQFAPFAALEGHDEAVRETARAPSSSWREPSPEELELLNERHAVLMEHLAERPEVTLTFFQPDEYKEGGAWLRRTASVEKVDMETRTLVLADGFRVPMDRLLAMEGDLFRDLPDRE